MNNSDDIIIQSICHQTRKGNRDNISRTESYEKYYFAHPEIKWALLAGLVSRNAGWNMCDLEGKWLPEILSSHYRKLLFFTYERANWLIFDDAFPQLMVYHYSTIHKQPMFHLLRKFHVSAFMEKEWEYYWKHKDQKRLLYALIINEQNLIQESVILHSYYKNKVFQSLLYKLQDYFHYSMVLFPTLSGEIYGINASHFVKLDSRIEIGKRLSHILFKSDLYYQFIDFARSVRHTGSRYDYERFMISKHEIENPPLRLIYPIIQHEPRGGPSWDKQQKIKKKWFYSPKFKENILITDWYTRKRKELELLVTFSQWSLLKGK